MNDLEDEVVQHGRLNGEVAIVTGGGGGIGRAISLRFAAEGAAVAIADVNLEAARRVADEVAAAGRRSHALQVDVTDAQQVEAMVARTVSKFGKLTVMVANAGILQVKPILDISPDEWDRMIDVNVKGVFLCVQAAGRVMREQRAGKVLIAASIAGKIASPYQAHYVVSKTALVGLTRAAATEFAPWGVTVNAYCPGIVDSPMWDIIDRERGALMGLQPGELKERIKERIPLGRREQPEDVANLVSFLASSDASYITGQAINVDGGFVMH